MWRALCTQLKTVHRRIKTEYCVMFRRVSDFEEFCQQSMFCLPQRITTPGLHIPTVRIWHFQDGNSSRRLKYYKIGVLIKNTQIFLAMPMFRRNIERVCFCDPEASTYRLHLRGILIITFILYDSDNLVYQTQVSSSDVS